MSEFVLFGADYSVYTRIPRLILEEARVDYRLEPVDIFAEEGPPDGYLDRHPFHKIPLLVHDDFEIYESDAIADYVVSTTGVDLIPEAGRARARMRQIMRIVDNYAYPVLTWDVYVREHLEGKPVTSETQEAAERVLRTLDELLAGPFFMSEQFSLADCWVVPVMDYLLMTERGRDLFSGCARLSGWWPMISERPAVARTKFVDERED